MGSLEVISVPSKSYVAINSYKCDKSISPTLCDLGRVSYIAAAVTLPRTSNFENKNSVPRSVRSLPYKKRPIPEVVDCINSNSFHENVPKATSETTILAPHKTRRYTPENQSSTSILATQSTTKTNPNRNGTSNPQVKRMKYNYTETSNMVSSQSVSAADNKINSVSCPQNTTRNVSTHLPFPHSTIQTVFVLPTRRCSQETTAHSHVQRNQHGKLHYSNTPQLLDHQNVQLPTTGMGQLPTHNSVPKQLQQQNQQLSNERHSQETTAHSHLQRNHHDRLHDSKTPQQLNHQNVQLQQQNQQLRNERCSQETTAHSHLQRNQNDRLNAPKTPQQLNHQNVQLQQQNQQLLSENVQLQKQLSLFRQLIKNPKILNQFIARLEQRVY